ncbi:Uncharacterised protein [Zhongshania aliphaticivorans]|jgi:hypothetical protein|uniref:Uncharacterized protein n=1 Tax=Zhongshania aliphaticivorans TaxID=1470434 RepID=A0A5S9PR40_9GAMM|nr:Uncharacterised protein [Zhongshania aliphaticivorans]
MFRPDQKLGMENQRFELPRYKLNLADNKLRYKNVVLLELIIRYRYFS